MAENGEKELRELGRLSESLRKKIRSRDRASVEKFSIGATVVDRIKAIPKPTKRELAKMKRQRKEREERERLGTITNLLGNLLRDCGSRLDPFKRCTLAGFDRYDPEPMKKTLGRLEDYVANIRENVESGRSIFLIGPPGTGKDHLAVSIAREVVVQCQLSARWIDAATFRSELRDAIKSAREEKRILDRYVRAGVLVLSDPAPPASNLTDYQAEMIFRLIDGRYRAHRPTIVTANFESEAEAVAKIGSQTVDRLSHDGLRLLCKWESYRRR